MAEANALPVVEWSPGQCASYDPVTGVVRSGSTLAEVSGSLSQKNVVLAISRRASFVRAVRLPDVARPEMARILSLQVSRLFPIEDSDAAVDFTVLEDRNEEGRLVVAVAVLTDVLRQAQKDSEEAGLNVVSTVPAAASSMSQQVGDGAIVGESGSSATIDIVRSGAVRLSRTVPYSGQAGALMVEVNRTFASADIEVGPVKTVGKLKLPGASSLEVEPLALISNDTCGFNIELRETALKREFQRSQKSKNLAMLLWVAAIGVGAVVFDIRSDQFQMVAKGEKTWNKRISGLKSTNAQAQSKATELRSQKDLLNLAFEPKQGLGDVVTVMSNLTPGQLWLTGISVERGKRATLRGTALTSQAVSSYLASLGKQSRMRDVKLVFANNALVEKTPVVNFSISGHVVGNFPLPDEKGAVSR